MQKRIKTYYYAIYEKYVKVNCEVIADLKTFLKCFTYKQLLYNFGSKSCVLRFI